MAQNKTIYTNASVDEFLAQVENEQKRKDSKELIILMSDACGELPRMFGPTIIGFGQYHYKYDSGHEGDAPILGFSPRKAAISLYIYIGIESQRNLLDKLGKFKMGKACIYINKLSDINIDVMKEIMASSIEYVTHKYQRILL